MANEKDKDRWVKLNALANNPGASPAERKTARKVLCALDARMGGYAPINASMDIDVSQAWEIALLTELSNRHGLNTVRQKGIMRLTGKHEEAEKAMLAYCQLRPDLERVVMLSAAGWLARNFPKKITASPSGPQLSDDEAKVVRAAATAARPERYARQRIGAADPKRLTKKD